MYKSYSKLLQVKCLPLRENRKRFYLLSAVVDWIINYVKYLFLIATVNLLLSICLLFASNN
ncbi:hypothetical protein PGB90_004417 [Kerria lacca]